jgi:two-component system, cell cycle response regulator
MSELARGYSLLVVDDSPVYRKLVEQILGSEPLTLLFAVNGSEAMKLVEQHSPDIVLTDWMMPDFSGPELCQRIRARGGNYTYLILMTSDTRNTNVVEGLAAGADDYIAKPCVPAEMLARIGVGRRIVDLNRELCEKNKKLEEAARTDSLTNLPNRRAIEEWAVKQLRGSARHGFPLWLVLGDIDNFKSINDTYGHEAGDVVLKACADVLRKSTRSSDLCGRFGGDEFLMVITHVDTAAVEFTVNRFRERLDAQRFSFLGQTVATTASFGIAGTLSKDVQEFGAILRAADEMLYEAKRAGRNRVRMAGPRS